ncbi:MAG: coproporphyrinogen-III oxidase family protein [Xenococcaceae cyanobacterium]
MQLFDSQKARKSSRETLIEKAKTRVNDLYKLQKAGLICKSGDFFPSVHYPPITMYKEMTEEKLFANYSLPEDGKLDIYVHLPFCNKHCVYCHYPVKLGEQIEEKNKYLTYLEKEFDLYMNILGVDKLKPRSILVGGGTPTYLTLSQQKRLLDILADKIDLSIATQFNWDVDPKTLTGEEGIERLNLLKDYGSDRLTIGTQSLNEEILKLMNRHHGVKEIYEAINNCQKLGYQLDIEFIFGYPGQTLKNWLEVMEEAVTLGVEEIQLYRLKIEAYGDYQGTIKAVREKGLQDFPSLEETIMMKQLAIDTLAENGYHENLRRVFTTKPEYYSHYADNQCCGLLDQVGFGLTAFSSMRDRFGLNTQYFPEYYAKIDAAKLPLNRGMIRSKEEQMRWAIILPLKNRCVWKEYYKKVTGGEDLDRVFRRKIENLKEFGLIAEDEQKIQLTKLGAFFADEVAQQFHHPDYIPYSRDEYEPGPLYPYNNCQP